MSLASIALNQISVVFMIIIIGVICFKIKLIDQETNRRLSNLLLMLVNPILIFVSYQRDFTKDLLNGLLISFLLAIITHIVGIFLARLFIRGKKNSDLVIERFSAIYSNCGFMGIPLVNGIVGGEGVFYLTAYITVFNIFIWTHGVIMMVGKQEPRKMLKTLRSPMLVSIFVGFIFFLVQIRIPKIMLESLGYVSSMNTPLAMIIAGATIGQTNIRKIFTKWRIYWISFTKLLLIPLALLLLYSIVDSSQSVVITSILAVACPTAASGTLFAIRYNKNALYASEIFGITTLLSLITIPIVMMLAELLL